MNGQMQFEKLNSKRKIIRLHVFGLLSIISI